MEEGQSGCTVEPLWDSEHLTTWRWEHSIYQECLSLPGEEGGRRLGQGSCLKEETPVYNPSRGGAAKDFSGGTDLFWLWGSLLRTWLPLFQASSHPSDVQLLTSPRSLGLHESL